MAGTTQYFGVTYPTSTDFVTNGATAIEAVADGFDAAVAIPTYNAQTGTTYTFVLLDAAKVVTSNNAAAVTFTVPPQASVVWTTGATLTVANYGAGAVTIAGGAGVTITNATATIAQFGTASIVRTGSNTWTVLPFAGGAAPLSDSAVSGTTGSPTTGTYTDTGINYKYYRFTGSGSITFNKAGLVDVLVVGAGGACGIAGRGGGAGGFITTNDFYVTAAAHTVTVAASVTGANRGGESVFRSLVAVGGGAGSGSTPPTGIMGGSGGATGGSSATATSITNQGNIGGSGGGGGAGGAGGATAGGVGTSSSITGAAVTYAAGGSSTTPVTATANTGNGAGGSAITNTSGSGVVIVRVRQ